MKSLISLLIISIASFSAGNWDDKFADVCKYDEYCRKLKSSDGIWFKPKPETLLILKDPDMQKVMKETAQKAGVDPVAIAGAIIAENSLNVGVKDGIQTLLASKLGITNIAGKSFSFGLGQINIEPAMEAERHMAKIEGRSPRSQDEIVKEIVDPAGAIRMVGSILRKVQDDYKEQGIDISKDPGVLTTLYNLGKSEEKAKRAKAENRMPRVNYFGLFVEKYKAEISVTAGAATPQKPVVASIVPQVPQTMKAADVDKGDKAKVQAQPIKKNLVKIDTVSRNLALANSPLQCESQNGVSASSEARSMVYGAPSGVLEKGQGYTEVSRAFDCKSNIWTLVQGEKGQTGWVQNQSLEAVKTVRMDEVQKCSSSKADAACMQAIQKASANMTVSEDKEKGVLYLKPITASENAGGTATFEEEDATCGYKVPETEMAAKSGSKSGVLMGRRQIASLSELQAKAKSEYNGATKILSTMKKQLGLSDEEMSGPANPYSELVQSLNYIKINSQGCLNSLNTEFVNCYISEGIEQALENASKLEFKKKPSFKEIQEMMTGKLRYGGRYDFSTYTPDPNDKQKLSPSEIRESIAECQTRMNKQVEIANKSQKALVDKYNADMAANGGKSTALPISGAYVSFNGTTTQYVYRMFNLSLQPIGRFFNAISSAPDEKLEKYSSELTGFANFCHARMGLTSSNSQLDKYNCIQAKNYVRMDGYRHFSKELIKEAYESDPMMPIGNIISGQDFFFPSHYIGDLSSAQPVAAADPKSETEKQDKYPYCPGKTAEHIENLLKENKCIQRVYIPSKIIAKQLSEYSDKVIYRKFDTDGRYAIEIGANSCK